MAARLVLAIAADRKVRVLRKRGEHIEHPAVVRLRHLGAVLASERRPLRCRLRTLPQLHRSIARREVRKPDVVPVLRSELFLRHAARRAAYRPDAQAFAVASRSSQPDDADRHRAQLAPAAKRSRNALSPPAEKLTTREPLTRRAHPAS